MRIQFYPNQILEQKLQEEANKANVTISTLVVDLLNHHYGLVPEYSKTNVELRKIVFAEITEFIKTWPAGEEFDLNMASGTYENISMVYAGKPSAIKAQIGREFNGKCVAKIEPFDKVVQVRLSNGKPKLTVKNRAAIYIKKEE